MTGTASLPARHFDDVYAASDDPWSFETSAYEAVEYADSVAALGERSFWSGFEIGARPTGSSRRQASSMRQARAWPMCATGFGNVASTT